MRKQYKETISNYKKWEQLEHAEEYILFPGNFGQDMSLDETCLSNGEVYTILTNKAGKGRKGTLAAMIRGVSSDTVSEILKKVPHEIRRRVKTVTTDLSSAMMLIVSNVFKRAQLINDRFHVQKLMSEAIDQMRVSFRWEVLAAENEAINEYKEKRKAASTEEERKSLGRWIPEKMKNKETKPQVMARSRHILLKHMSKWNQQQRERAVVLFEMFPELKRAYDVYLKLIELYNKKSTPEVARLDLARWFNEVKELENDNFNKVIQTFENHSETIINYFIDRMTNASAESFNAKIKAFRAQFRGVGDIRFFMYRLTTLYS